MDLCRDLLHYFDEGDLDVGHAPKSVQGWLETLGLETDLLRLLQWYWPQTSGGIGPLHVYSSRDLRKTLHLERLLHSKLLPIGHALTGDPLVLDFTTATAQPAFVAHDRFWEEEDLDPRSCMLPIARSLPSLLWRLAEGKYVPHDFYAAEALRRFLEEERAAGG